MSHSAFTFSEGGTFHILQLGRVGVSPPSCTAGHAAASVVVSKYGFQACSCPPTIPSIYLHLDIHTVPSFSVSGWSSHLHDLHHWTAHSVCGYRTDIQEPQESQCTGRHLCPTEMTYRTLTIQLYLLETINIITDTQN